MPPLDSLTSTTIFLNSLSIQIQSAQTSRSDCYRHYDEAIGKFKQSKDASLLAAARKKIEADHKKATTAVAEQIDLLRSNGAAPDVLERVNELQKLDNAFKDQVCEKGVFRWL